MTLMKTLEVVKATASLSTNPQFLALIEQSSARQKAQGGISSPEVRRRLGLKQRAKQRSASTHK
jgi:hypothetical protein